MCEAPEECNDYALQRTHPTLAQVVEMISTEKCGHQQGRGPETHSSGQGELRIAAVLEFLGQANQQAGERPQERRILSLRTPTARMC